MKTMARLPFRLVLIAILCGLVAVALPSPASADDLTLDFHDVSIPNGFASGLTTYANSGFTMLNIGLFGPFMGFEAVGPNNFEVYAGVTTLIPIAPNNGDIFPTTVDLHHDDGTGFTLLSIDFVDTLFSVGLGDTLEFTGFLVGGGTVTQEVDFPAGTSFPSTLQTITFTGFTNIQGVAWKDLGSGANDFKGFTNIKIETSSDTGGGTTPVPEPATLTLFGTGIASSAALRRKKTPAKLTLNRSPGLRRY